jgi:DNA-binding FadR family transcriptional regulator
MTGPGFAAMRNRLGRLCSSTTDAIGRLVVSGQIKPGEHLPTEAELCGQLGVSRTTVREAIKQLQGKGLLDSGPRTGMRVLSTACWNQLDGDVLGWRAEGGLTAELADQIYDLRGCVEPQSCRMAAVRATGGERRDITAAFELISSTNGSVDAHVAADVAFHLAIFAATQNPFLITLGSAIRTGLELAFHQSQQRRPMSDMELALHGRIARAIAAAEPDRAATAMTRLLRVSRRALAC